MIRALAAVDQIGARQLADRQDVRLEVANVVQDAGGEDVHVDGEPAQGGSEIRVKVEQRVLKVVAREGA